MNCESVIPWCSAVKDECRVRLRIAVGFFSLLIERRRQSQSNKMGCGFTKKGRYEQRGNGFDTAVF
jgi:hypothetical protein